MIRIVLALLLLFDQLTSSRGSRAPVTIPMPTQTSATDALGDAPAHQPRVQMANLALGQTCCAEYLTGAGPTWRSTPTRAPPPAR